MSSPQQKYRDFLASQPKWEEAKNLDTMALGNLIHEMHAFLDNLEKECTPEEWETFRQQRLEIERESDHFWFGDPGTHARQERFVAKPSDLRVLGWMGLDRKVYPTKEELEVADERYLEEVIPPGMRCPACGGSRIRYDEKY